MTTNRRIVSIDPKPIAKILALIYGILAILGLITLAFSGVEGAKYLTFPFGLVVPGFRLALNLNLGLSANPIIRSLIFLAQIPWYALTGWIGGYLLTISFNVVARYLGGIDAKFVELPAVAKAP